MLKKILSFALALLIVGSMVACKNNKNPEEGNENNNQNTEQPGENNGENNGENGGENNGEAGGENNGEAGGENNGENNGETGNESNEIKFNEVNEKVYALVTVQLRRAPMVDSANVVGELRVNEVTTRIGVSEDGKWSKIYYEVEGLEGEYYVASTCLALYAGGNEEKPGDGDETPGENGQPETPPVTDPNAFVPITPSEYVYVATDALNLRTEPSTNGKVVTKLYFGTKLERVAKNQEWSVVIYNGAQYYLNSAYLTTEDVTGSDFIALDQPVVKTVTAASLKKRTSPWMDETNENVAGYLTKGATVTCVAISPDGAWYRIQEADGQYYYVGARYLSGYVPGQPSVPEQNEPTQPAVAFTALTEPVLMYAINKTGGVRVYASPDVLTPAVATLTTGSPVVCTAISTDQTWYKVTLPDQAGEFYIHVSDLQTGGKS